MRKSDLIKNPLFEKLIERSIKYEPLYERINEQEEKPSEEKQTSDLDKITGEIIFGAYSLINSSIISFPSGKYKDEFSPKFISFLEDLKSDTSPSVLIGKISKMLSSFIEGASGDPSMEDLEDAYNDYSASMDLYVQAMEELKKQEAEKVESEGIKKFIGNSLSKSIESTKDTISKKGKIEESIINESLEEKRTKKFIKKGNMISFVNNCKTLISSIKSKIDQISTYRINSPNLKTPGEYSSVFTDLLNRAAKLEVDAKTTRKNDGKKIDDNDLINEYNEIYLGIKKDFDNSSTSFDNKIKDERIKYLKSLKYSRISDIVSKAVSLKNSGDEKSRIVMKPKNDAEKKEKSDTAGNSKKSGLQIKNPIKRADTKGKKNSDVEEFQKLVIEKFKNVKGVSESDIFKKFMKYGADGFFGPTTTGIIQGLKAGFGLEDRSSDITQELIDKINTENLMESRITRFSDFERLFKIMEKFDVDAFKKTIEQGGARGDEKPASKSSISSAIKNSGTDKKISQEEIKKEIEKGIEKFKSDLSREEIIKKLVKIDGIKKNDKFDGEKSYAIGLSDGMSFFDNGRALRRFDKVIGTYDIEKDEFKGDDGSVDKLSKIVKDVTPEKYGKKCKELYNDLYLGGARNKKLYTDLLGWSTESMKLLAQAYKDYLASKNKSSNLYDDLLDEWTSTDEINKLVKKFRSVLE